MSRKTIATLIGLATIVLVPVGASDRYPGGCIDCHVVTEDGDFRVNTLLEAKGHKRINEGGDQVPGGCNYCHAADDEGTATPMRNLMHMIHYELPEENLFVADYASDCRHCHSMSEQDGIVTIKTGTANWTVETSDASD